jgi:hypothetical protein
MAISEEGNVCCCALRDGRVKETEGCAGSTSDVAVDAGFSPFGLFLLPKRRPRCPGMAVPVGRVNLRAARLESRRDVQSLPSRRHLEQTGSASVAILAE